MIRRIAGLAGLLATLMGSSPLLAEAPALRFNPFERPELGVIAPVKNTLLETESVAPALTATMVSSEEPMVILEGEFLRVGEEREGYRLVSVSEGSALFDHQGEQVEIKVNEPSAVTGFRR